VTTVCPNGHHSATSDYCDQCGSPLVAPAQPTAVLAESEEIDTSTTAAPRPCPVCHSDRSGDDRFCEQCGHDLLAPEPIQGSDWEAVLTADRLQFERCASAGIEFPEGYEEQSFALDRAELRIGRSSGRGGEPALEIDLSGRHEDPGVSRRHAVLERLEDGSYAVRDLGSTNGTTVNDGPRPIGSDAVVPLADGDRIGLGAWTTITVRTASKVVRREQS
jgi:hypothetical protein